VHHTTVVRQVTAVDNSHAWYSYFIFSSSLCFLILLR